MVADYLTAAEKLGFAPARTVVFEDSTAVLTSHPSDQAPVDSSGRFKLRRSP